jgi:hypothetical protein
LWAMLRRPNLTLAASFLLYLAARHFSWNLSAYPIGSWYFNPFVGSFCSSSADGSRSAVQSSPGH